ncbi:MAG: (Fe-S)-binding protein [Candidatus Thiodiazotropha sp.]
MPEQKRYPAKPNKAYFFATCLVDLLYPEAGLAGMQLIRREGVEVIFPQDQTCCGQPAWNSGYRDEARMVALRQLACFAEDYPVVVPSGSCAGMMRHHYPEMLRGHADESDIEAFCSRVYELTEFLVHVLQIELKDLGEPVKVALHTSCSARREMGVADEHEVLLKQLSKVELLEQARKEECCGFGGTFAIKQPALSAEMVSDKANAIIETGADLLVSGDCGCLMNLGGHLDYRESSIESRHIASFVWERTHATER